MITLKSIIAKQEIEWVSSFDTDPKTVFSLCGLTKIQADEKDVIFSLLYERDNAEASAKALIETHAFKMKHCIKKISNGTTVLLSRDEIVDYVNRLPDEIFYELSEFIRDFGELSEDDKKKSEEGSE